MQKKGITDTQMAAALAARNYRSGSQQQQTHMTAPQTEVGGGAIVASVDSKYYMDKAVIGRTGTAKNKERGQIPNQTLIENDYEDCGNGGSIN